jgi:hypothetical protein
VTKKGKYQVSTVCHRKKTPFSQGFPILDVVDYKPRPQKNVCDIREKVRLEYPSLHFKKSVR